MQVLLIGEYSGLHLNLAIGLRKLGVDVLFTSRGDGWKQIPSVNYLGSDGASLLAKLSRVLVPVQHIRELSGADVAQFIAVNALHPLMMKLIGNRNKKKFCVAAGTDSLTAIQFIRQTYSPLHAELEQHDYTLLAKLQPRLIRRDHQVIEWADGLIAAGLPYYYAYKHMNKLKALIPLPIDVDGIVHAPNRVDGKVRLFHGVSRSAFKGSPVILRALARLQATYPGRVEVVTKTRVPFAEYVDMLKNVNVIIDQAYSLGYGMNALYGLAYGKIVLSGSSTSLLDAFQFAYCPVVNVDPDEDQIYRKLEQIILLSDIEIAELGNQSRAFVEQYHESKKVAQRYLSVWNSS